MTKRQTERIARILPNGQPKHVRVYDNGGPDVEGGSGDRYTVIYSGRYFKGEGALHAFQFVGMNASPFHPQFGVCSHGDSRLPLDAPEGWAPQIGRKVEGLGRRIPFESLPDDCKRVVMQDYCELWGVPMPVSVPPASVTTESEL